MTENSVFLIVRTMLAAGMLMVMVSPIFWRNKKVILTLLLVGVTLLAVGLFWGIDRMWERRQVVPRGEENIFLNRADQEKKYKDKIFGKLKHLKDLQLESKNCGFCLEKESKVEKYYQEIDVDLNRFADFYRKNPDPKFFVGFFEVAAIGDNSLLSFDLGNLYLKSPDAFLYALSEISEDGQKAICVKRKLDW